MFFAIVFMFSPAWAQQVKKGNYSYTMAAPAVLVKPYIQANVEYKNEIPRQRPSGEYSKTTSGQGARVRRIGKQIVEANGVTDNIRFVYSTSSQVNAHADAYKQVVIYKGLIKETDSDDEIAGIISHEIGHVINSHIYKSVALHSGVNIAAMAIPSRSWQNVATMGAGLAMTKVSRVHETQSDTAAVDLMVNAGYDPVAYMSILAKIGEDYVDVFKDHPSTTKRLTVVYNYIGAKYPQYLKNVGRYDSPQFQDFLEYAHSNGMSR